MLSRASAILTWLTRHPTIALGLFTVTVFGAYLPGMKMEATIFADSAGRWIQIQGLLQQNYGSLECVYDTGFDPEFRFRPGPWYFFWIKNETCYYFYPYLYAFVVAPFVQLAPDYGYFILNLVFLLLFVYASAGVCGQILEDPVGRLLGGALALLVIPSPTFAYELSDVMMAMSLFAAALWAVVSGLNLRAPAFGPATLDAGGANAPPSKVARPHLACIVGGGILAGFAFALRTEALLVCASMAGALLVLAIYRERTVGRAELHGALITTSAFCAGALVTIAPITLWQLSFYGDVLGSRGAAHAEILSTEMTIAERLLITDTLLFGGSQGLFSALPSTALAFIWLVFPGARRACGAPGWFLFSLSGGYSLAVLLTAPNDGGYAWSPRYLAPMLPALYAGILVLVFRWRALRQRWIWRLLLIALCIHAVNFTHRGMSVIQRASKQNAVYSRAIQEFDAHYIVFDASPAMGFLAEDIIDQKQLYMAESEEDAQALVNRLAANKVQRWLYLQTPFGKRMIQDSMPVQSASGQITGSYLNAVQNTVEGMRIHLMQWQPAGGQH